MSTTFTSEKAFQDAVREMAKLGGWLCFHPFSSKRSEAGFPDLTLVHPASGRLVFVELKSAKGRLRPEQETWLAALGRQHETYVWRPADWPVLIQRVLLAERGVAA